MIVDIKIKTDNDAFGDSPQVEVARILREIADRIEANGISPKPIKDINGNVVGMFAVRRQRKIQ